mmetsp:Transcript_30433/g.65156  ORF Transcript_30433/g.65156 Transcript_30433/m.65156 type:complete len:265 (+) Transcript_30433:2-796(+)
MAFSLSFLSFLSTVLPASSMALYALSVSTSALTVPIVVNTVTSALWSWGPLVWCLGPPLALSLTSTLEIGAFFPLFTSWWCSIRCIVAFSTWVSTCPRRASVTLRCLPWMLSLRACESVSEFSCCCESTRALGAATRGLVTETAGEEEEDEEGELIQDPLVLQGASLPACILVVWTLLLPKVKLLQGRGATVLEAIAQVDPQVDLIILILILVVVVVVVDDDDDDDESYRQLLLLPQTNERKEKEERDNDDDDDDDVDLHDELR